MPFLTINSHSIQENSAETQGRCPALTRRSLIVVEVAFIVDFGVALLVRHPGSSELEREVGAYHRNHEERQDGWAQPVLHRFRAAALERPPPDQSWG